ncbi:hypothetical protein K3495_g280 [Podosphaera aphanis]|nr:hypothetical protein K3495_g280 [Podosphaera aphanis]
MRLNLSVFYSISYPSYDLQPLDLITFSSIKAKYRAKIAELGKVDDNIEIKKQTSIKICAKASYDGLDSAHI